MRVDILGNVANEALGTIDEVLEELLDQEDVEVDPIDRMEGDSPLHKAVRYVNKLNQGDWASAAPLVELLVEAGSDPRSDLMFLKLRNSYCRPDPH